MRFSQRSRRITLADAAVLIMATAVGLVLIRDDLSGLLTVPKVLENEVWVSRWSLPTALSKIITAERWLIAWTAGWLILLCRSPRSGRRRLARQPGFVACFCSSIVGLVSGGITYAAIATITSGQSAWLDRMIWGEWVSAQIGSAILAAWVLLMVRGSFRIRVGWMDRVGQFIGLFWILMIPANLFHFFWYSGWSN